MAVIKSNLEDYLETAPNEEYIPDNGTAIMMHQDGAADSDGEETDKTQEIRQPAADR